jgi:phosphatidylinositol alpha-1,6-mannosyltransferase
MEKIKILFISRAYPPITGGIENQNHELSIWLPKITETRTIANTRGKKFLPFFLPYALLKSLWLFREYDVVLLGDGVLAIVGWFLKLIYEKPVVCVVHGLDLTFKNALYQKLWVGFFIKNLDRLIAVGNETVAVGINKDIPKEKLLFIPNGVDPEKFIGSHEREKLAEILQEDLTGKKVLLTTGRLAIHKGVDWFCAEVMPLLAENILYVIAGDGIKRGEIEKIIQDKKLEHRVKMLGQVTDEVRNILYNTADLYVKPNIKVAGTMEGFGLVAIEAASCKLPVIASDLEGLKDAIKDGQNGFLIEPSNAADYCAKINDLLARNDYCKEFGEKARQYVIDNYSWNKISQKYVSALQETLNK